MPAGGAAQCRAIARACEAAGSRGLLNSTRRTMRATGRPLVLAAQAAARRELPKEGGLNEYVASQRWTVSTLAGARTAGILLRTRTPATAQTDLGFVRHPIWGHRGPGQWRTNSTQAGWASDTVDRYGPPVAAIMMRDLDSIAAGIARSAGGS